MEMFEHLNEHLVMKYHESRTKDLMNEARRERLKNDVLRQAAQERRQRRASVVQMLWQRAQALWQRERPTVKPTISLVDEHGL